MVLPVPTVLIAPIGEDPLHSDTVLVEEGLPYHVD